MLKYEEIDLKHKCFFEKYLKEYPPQISEHTFTNLYIWKNFRKIIFCEEKDTLLLFADYGEFYTLFGPPLGKMSISDAMKLRLDKPIQAFERIPEGTNISDYKMVEDRNNFDYVYKRQDLADLEGRHFHAKRNLISQCLANYNCIYEEITPANLQDIAEMMESWCKKRECGKNASLCSEYHAMKKILENYFQLDVIGAAIRINDNIEAFTIGEALNKNTSVIHFEKASSDFKGLYQLINQWFCKNNLSQFEFVNREQDLGIEGLRKAKESYFPDHYIKKHKGDGSPSITNGNIRCF